MKTAFILLAGVLAASSATAAAPRGICIDPDYSYQARYLSGQDIVAKSTLGRDHRELKLSTTCIFLSQADRIALSADFSCIGKGDTVITSTIDGRHQSCRITHVEPYAPAAAPEHS